MFKPKENLSPDYVYPIKNQLTVLNHLINWQWLKCVTEGPFLRNILKCLLLKKISADVHIDITRHITLHDFLVESKTRLKHKSGIFWPDMALKKKQVFLRNAVCKDIGH